MRSIATAASLVLLLTGCGDGARPAADTTPAAAPAGTTNRLPLATGYYVATDTPCDEASNATLSLFVGDALNGARDACAFTSVEATGPGAWRVTERCIVIGEEGDGFTQTVAWTATDDRSFTRVTGSGWEHRARLCPQAELPEPWREIDLAAP